MKVICLLLLLPIFAISQANYYTFKYNNHYGIASQNGEIIKEPIFTDLEEYNTIDNLAILQNSENKTVIFNLTTAETSIYDKFYPNEVFIDNQYFALIKNNNKQFLLGQQSGFIIQLYNTISDFENLGTNFIIARVEVPKNKNKTTSKTTNNPTRYLIFKNSKNLELITQINSLNLHLIDNYYTIQNNYDSEKLPESIVSKTKPWHHFLDFKFDYFTIKKQTTFDLFDKNFKLLQTIKYKETNYDLSVQNAIKLLEKNNNLAILDATENSFTPAVFNETNEPIFLEIISENNQNTLMCYQNNLPLLLFKTASKITQISFQEIILEDQNGNIIETTIDYNKPTLQLPKKFLNQFSISFEK